jgi:glycosyltransferase involved in cell wall biosynthesis
MPQVSVVTPVYNGDKYLAECIESVRAQTLTDWEYIIVNNCSTDRSLSIAESYAQRDKRIRVYSNDQVLPVIANFNRAWTLVPPGARYLKFLCADDTLFPDCLQKMVDVAESNPTVRLVASYKIHGRTPVCEGPPYPHVVASGKDVCRWFFEGRRGVLGSPTDLLIRLPTSTVDGRLLDETFLHADTEFYVRVLKDGADYGFVHQVLTFTRTHEEAVSVFAHVMGTGRLESLAMMVKHGPAFLSERDRKVLERAHRRDYSRFLFRVMLKGWDRRIWKYQRTKRKSLGIRIGVLEFLRAGLLETAMSVLSPVETARRITRDLARVKNGG